MFRPFWPCVPLLGVFLGVPFWAPHVFWILLGPSEALSWDARRQGSSCVSLVLFFFFPFCFAATLFLDARVGSLTEVGQKVVLPTPRPSEGQEMPSLGRGLWTPPFRDFVGIFCCQWGQGPTDAWRPGPFCVGRGPFACPLTGPFHTARFFPPQVFFLPLGPRLPWIACWSRAFCLAFIPRGAAEWLARVDCSVQTRDSNAAVSSVHGRTNSESCSETLRNVSGEDETPSPTPFRVSIFYRR